MKRKDKERFNESRVKNLIESKRNSKKNFKTREFKMISLYEQKFEKL